VESVEKLLTVDYGTLLKQFVLEKVRLGLQIPVDAYLLQTMKVDVHKVHEDMFTDMMFRMEAFVLQDQLPPRTVSEEVYVTTSPVPVTWWDHFKVEMADKWWFRWTQKYTWAKRRIFPPRMEAQVKLVRLSVDLERWISYPEAQSVPETMGKQYRGYKLVPTTSISSS
jgi:hypothetical protein